MKRVMCIYLPNWPVQNLWHLRPELRDKPVALTERQRGIAVVTSCCPRALRAGIRPGMAQAEALAAHAELLLYEHDRAGDRRSLERLAQWAERYSPIVAVEEGEVPQALLLDITGCAACFHGEDQLAQRAAHELRGRGWQARLAIADTVGAAWALTRGEGRGARGEEDAAPLLLATHHSPLATHLGPLPVTALRLPAEAVATLAALGIERIEQLAALPRSSVPGRFGAEVLRRLDQSLGRLPEIIVPHRPPQPIQAGCALTYATDRIAVLEHALDWLLERIEAQLRSRNRGARTLECWLYPETTARTPPAPVRLEVSLFRPSASARHLRKLLRARLERVRLAEPVIRLCLRVPDVEFMVQRQFELFDMAVSHLEELGSLVDRLVSQFGAEAVSFARLVEDCQPECAYRFEPAIAAASNSRKPAVRVGEAAEVPEGQRPLLVWPAPLPIEVEALLPSGVPGRFTWLGKEYTVRAGWGPERIETGWWRDNDVRRDYYTVATDRGTRLWLFRRHQDNRWFLHGCFD